MADFLNFHEEETENSFVLYDSEGFTRVCSVYEQLSLAAYELLKCIFSIMIFLFIMSFY